MDENGVTFMNVIELPAVEVDGFVEQWRERAKLMRDAPGFRDSRLHRAKLPNTRFQLVNVAHWDSVEAWESAIANPAFQTAVRGVPGVVTPNPALYDVVVEYEQS
jgi:heme-degrading monooxygenase HmoA